MTLQATLILVVVLVGNAAGQLLLKGASLRAEGLDPSGHWTTVARQPMLWTALTIYAFMFLVWLAFLSLVPLWQGIMVACIDILLIMLGGHYFFNETITRPRAAAVSLIAIGVFLVGWGGG